MDVHWICILNVQVAVTLQTYRRCGTLLPAQMSLQAGWTLAQQCSLSPDIWYSAVRLHSCVSIKTAEVLAPKQPTPFLKLDSNLTAWHTQHA